MHILVSDINKSAKTDPDIGRCGNSRLAALVGFRSRLTASGADSWQIGPHGEARKERPVQEHRPSDKAKYVGMLAQR